MTSEAQSAAYLHQLESMRAFIGNTPMAAIHYAWKGTPRVIYAKLEYFNYTGSIKDRMALHILLHAASRGFISKGTHIVEASSGNTGISFAALGKKLGNPVTIVVPDWISAEKKAMIRSYGATVCEVSTEDGGFLNAMLMCESIADEQSDVFVPRQFSNPVNTEVHEHHTGEEIIAQLKRLRKTPDGFTAGVGTGGTIMGVTRLFKAYFPDILISAVEPFINPQSGTGAGRGQSHRIHGIADNFVPVLINPKALDNTLKVNDGDAIFMAQRFMSEIGLGVGISGAANFLAAVELHELLGDDKTIVTIFPDTCKNYLHAELSVPERLQPHYRSNDIDLMNYSPVPSIGRAVL